MKENSYKIINNKEDHKMARYIVEAPKPKQGQIASSGGIRENGRISSQFKNPVPYNEPLRSSTIAVHKPNSDLICNEQLRSQRKELGIHLLGLIWQDFGEPVIRSWLHKKSTEIINRIETSTYQELPRVSSTEPKKRDVESVESEPEYDNYKTISFPIRTVS